ncbi:hypothetical protein ABZ468_52835 [Streptomyces sp. NPDC005708]|uniref:hypothetical protein n=1 Tax=Streptomyces sp. NPDC005708 TaxID=3154564 RepID=UPI0033CDB40F
MEMLREETPIWVQALTEINVQIGALQEPIGEGERPAGLHDVDTGFRHSCHK